MLVIKFRIILNEPGMLALLALAAGLVSILWALAGSQVKALALVPRLSSIGPLTLRSEPRTNSPAIASVLYVSGSGGATGAPCVNPTAYTTIQAAIDAATDGDEVRIAT